jgi:hypothetical protein
MNDPSAPNLAMDATPPGAAKFGRLFRLVEGLIDADLLLFDDGEALLAEIEVAGRALEEGDAAAVARHLARFIRTMTALMQSGLLEEAHGRAALEGARRMLDAAG